MNYLAHGHRFLERPWFLAGVALPDLLSMGDRRVRARSKYARPLLTDDDPRIREIAAGVIQHHHDDAWFHGTRAFVELSLDFSWQFRELLADHSGMRPSFLGHILVELLLDAELSLEDESLLPRYYAAFSEIDGGLLAAFVARVSRRAAPWLPAGLERFKQVRFLYGYTDDEKLRARLNGVLRRVALPELPPEAERLFPTARRDVRRRRDELLAGEATAPEGLPPDVAAPSSPHAPPWRSLP